MATSDDLRQIFTAGRPLVEEWLDIGEQIAALRDVAASKGLDWSQLKALMKAQIQDERDETGNGKRVARIVEKAEFASAYADMLGLANMNENNFSASQSYAEAKGVGHSTKSYEEVRGILIPPHDHETGEITDTQEQPEAVEQTSPAPTRKTAGSAPRNEGSEGANTEHDDVDGSTERAGHAGQPFDALTGQVETRTSEKIVERNTSGPDAKRATHSPETASQSEPVTPGPSSLAAREADESAAPIPPSAVIPPAAEKTGAAPLPSSAAPVEISDEDVPAFLRKQSKPLRPHCLNPDLCGGSGSKHCYSCLKARDDATVAA